MNSRNVLIATRVTGDETLAVTYKDLNGNEVTARTHNDYCQMAKNYCQKLISLKPRALRADFGQIFLDENQYLVKNNDEVLYEVAFTESFGGDVGAMSVESFVEKLTEEVSTRAR